MYTESLLPSVLRTPLISKGTYSPFVPLPRIPSRELLERKQLPQFPIYQRAWQRVDGIDTN